jgi:uncharacterized membrane protein
MLVIIGFWLGINKIFIDTTGGYLNKVTGVLSLVLSIMLFISFISNFFKNRT